MIFDGLQSGIMMNQQTQAARNKDDVNLKFAQNNKTSLPQ